MDPELTLFELREISSNILWSDPDHESYRMAELFRALDEWLTRGGFLPDDWEPEPTGSINDYL